MDLSHTHSHLNWRRVDVIHEKRFDLINALQELCLDMIFETLFKFCNVVLLMFFAFCLRTSKDSSMGEFDKYQFMCFF